ncbi:MAG: hypothetical protein JST00_31555 [Deltaproteobacteria bacterium]|nr:hypothetical protein [Deltaproteobacteria bacterium]
MSDAVHQALVTAMRTIRDEEVSSGMGRLLAFVESMKGERAYASLRRIDYAKDSAGITRSVRRALPGDASSELYFGLDEANMPSGKGIELGAGDAGSTYSNHRGELPSSALARIFRCTHDNDVQYALGIGYLGLVLKSAFETIPPAIALGKTRRRTIVFGFHGGDLFPLGEVTRSGFALRLDEKLLEAPRARPRLPRVRRWPGARSTARDWTLLAGRFARAISDVTESARWTLLAAERLYERGAFEDAAPLVDELLPLVSAISEPTVAHKIYVAAAYVRAGLGKHHEAAASLAKASATVARYADPFWRKHGKDDVKRCAAVIRSAARSTKKQSAASAWPALPPESGFVIEGNDARSILCLARPKRVTDAGEALTIAKRMKTSSETRVTAIARIHLRARDWKRLHALLRGLEDAMTLVDVCLGLFWEYAEPTVPE